MELMEVQELLAANASIHNASLLAEAEIPYSERPETYFVPVLFSLIFVTGVLGNGTLICMFVSDRKMRNEPNIFIFSLALGDLLLILTAVPFNGIIYALPSWPFGLAVCKLSETVIDLSVGVSVFTLTALSAARYFPVVDPMRSRSGGASPGVRFTAACSVAIWALSMAFAVPRLVMAHLVTFGDDYVACWPFYSEWACGMVVSHAIAYYAVPFFIIFVFYALMARRLLHSAKTLPGEQEGHGPARNRQVRARRKVARVVLAFVLVFWVCFTPHHIYALWYHCLATDVNEEYGPEWHYFRIFAFCLKFLNSCANPIALYCVSGVFRKKFQRYLGWLVRGGRRRRSSASLLTSSGAAPPPRRASRAVHRLTTRSRRSQRSTRTTLVTTFMNGAAPT
ncbi:CCHamide Receptor [Frankliniella occidentalis]|uniref:Neuropeptide CCHamide-1 receptor-like n=1 Tax=Frankliniella occidentalis TaxID=133901 RepID=A0A6J1RVL2_FRAOC|nr:neuropeptide CCHamide-1 receptor-like [Frankliniella occidentalis]KAE8751607.1 CCHamide Receptor [Frankliniella occidentalis]